MENGLAIIAKPIVTECITVFTPDSEEGGICTTSRVPIAVSTIVDKGHVLNAGGVLGGVSLDAQTREIRANLAAQTPTGSQPQRFPRPLEPHVSVWVSARPGTISTIQQARLEFSHNYRVRIPGFSQKTIPVPTAAARYLRDKRDWPVREVPLTQST